MTTLTLPPPGSHTERPAPPAPAAGTGTGQTPARQPRWVTPALAGLLATTAVLYLWGLGASGWAQQLLLRRRASRHQELEGVLLRLVRRVQLHHRGQAAGGAVGHGALGPTLRRQRLEHPRPPGPRGRGRRGRALRQPSNGGSVPVPACWPAPSLALTPVAALMFRFNNPDALLVLLLTGAAYATVRGLEDGRTRWLMLAGRPGRLRLHHQDAAGPARGAGLRTGVPDCRSAEARAAHRPARCLPAVALVVSSFWWVVVVMADPGRRPAVHRRIDRTTASGTSSSATTASAG